MDWKIEVIPVPVSDVERSKHFYADQLGFSVDLDTQLSGGVRLVQLTPAGSGCSIHLSTGILTMPAGVLEGLQITVTDIDRARTELVARGVDASPVRHLVDGAWVDGHGGDWNAFVFFGDPDGNGWVLQESPAPG